MPQEVVTFEVVESHIDTLTFADHDTLFETINHQLVHFALGIDLCRFLGKREVDFVIVDLE